MAQSIDEKLQQQYRDLDGKLEMTTEGGQTIRSDLLLTFPNEYPDNNAEVLVETDEFTAVCPWTGLPDFGQLTIRYVPGRACLELKSLKYYLLTFRSVGMVQEHIANRILADLVKTLAPKKMTVELDYKVRGGLHTVVRVEHP